MAGTTVVGGVDAWKRATETFQLNFPEAEVWNERAEDINPEDVAARVGRVDLLLAFPECTSHSVAKGSAPRCEISRETAFQVIRYARVFKPRWIVVEREFSPDDTLGSVSGLDGRDSRTRLPDVPRRARRSRLPHPAVPEATVHLVRQGSGTDPTPENPRPEVNRGKYPSERRAWSKTVGVPPGGFCGAELAA